MIPNEELAVAKVGREYTSGEAGGIPGGYGDFLIIRWHPGARCSWVLVCAHIEDFGTSPQTIKEGLQNGIRKILNYYRLQAIPVSFSIHRC